MNETMTKFGWPKTVIKDYDHWVLLLRPEQITLGAMVVAHKGQKEKMGELGEPAFAELANIVTEVEAVMSGRFNIAKVNYLALMMVDKQVHFHVIPRYPIPIEFNGEEFLDTGWPKAPDLNFENNNSELSFDELIRKLREYFKFKL